MSGPDCPECGEHFMSCHCEKSKMKHKYDIENLSKTFQEHAKEYAADPRNRRDAFNIAEAFATICREIMGLKKKNEMD